MGTPEFEPMAPSTSEELQVNLFSQLPDKQAMSIILLVRCSTAGRCSTSTWTSTSTPTSPPY